MNLATAAAGANLFEHIRETLWTAVPAFVVALIAFALLGEPGEFDATAKLAHIERTFVISPWRLMPLGVVFALAVLRCPVCDDLCRRPLGRDLRRRLQYRADDRLCPGPFAACAGCVAQGCVVGNGNRLCLDHRRPGNRPPAVARRHGVDAEYGLAGHAALAFGAVVEHAGLLNRHKRHLLPVALSRAVGDAGSVTSPLVPWNSCGAYMSAALGVPTLSYLGFAFFCLLNALATIAIAALGLRMRASYTRLSR